MNYNLNLRVRIHLTSKKLIVSSGGLALKLIADVPFIKIRKIEGNKVNEVLYVPGSTMKGLLRTSLIRTAHMLGANTSMISVYPTRGVGGKDIVTSLFGWVGWPPSKVVVSGAELKELTYTMSHVRIKEKEKVAEEGGLFSVEYIPIGTSFEFNIEANDITLEEVRALFLSILELRYERIGKSGIAEVYIVKNLSQIPDELKKDVVIKEILEGIGE